VPDIIAFSNQLCYEGKIKPLREDSDSPLHPHVVPYRVEGFQDEKTKVNHEEALTVASLLCAAIERPEYKGKSFGVISLLGDEQAREVENILQHVPPIEYERRRIICGNAAQFQGDERDVMFLTMVSSPREGPLRMSDDKMTRRRFNVAASRARDQLWLVYSLDPAVDLKEGDLRKRLIDHVVDPRAGSRELERLVSQTQSPFEERVLEHLVRRGYSVTPQWPVGAYRIDFVIEGGGRRMALECDGDRYHSDENIQQDIERQAILERLGWRFIRIRGSVFFRDPERTMQGVIKRLEEAGIPPEGHGAGQDSEDSALVAAIKARASELRTAWAQRSNLSNPSTGSDDGRGSGSHCLARKPVRRWRRPEEKSDSPSPVESNQSLGVLEPTEPSKNLTPRLRSGMTSSSPPELRRGLDSEANRMTATTDFEGLLNEVDRRIFPAVFNTPPAGSRKQRIKKWLSALESCPVTPTAILDALLKADPSLARPIEKTKVVDAIEAWSR
jgi:very-short-patch-repair endonuclease